MTDEIELLRRFRGELPEPSTDAWVRARAAIAAAAAEQDEPSIRPVSASGVSPDGDRRRSASGHRSRSRVLRRPRSIVLMSVAASVGLVAGLLVTFLPAAPGPSLPVHTPWQAARALPASRAQAIVHAPAGAWRLAGYITSEGWQRDTTGPEPGNLTCPTALTCYVTGDNATSSSGPADYDTLYVSNDGAQSWSALPVPSGVVFTTALACPSAESCAGGATYDGEPVLVTTTDGGHSFTINSLPGGEGQLYNLVCPSSSFCAGLVATTADPNGTPIDATFLSTSDGGMSFRDSSFPPAESMESLACATATDCVAVGTSDRLGVNDSTAGVVVSTTDGGTDWSSGAFPAGFGIYYLLSRIACADAEHCFVIGNIAIKNPNPPQCSKMKQFLNPPISPTTTTEVPTPSTVPSSAVQAIARKAAAAAAEAAAEEAKNGVVGCSYSITTVSDIAASSDGGFTWVPEALPANAPQPFLSDIACPSDEDCFVAGSADIPQSFGHNGSNGGSAIVLVTHDGGASWSRVTFAVPSSVPSGMQVDAFMAIGDIQCPQVNDCTGLGVSDQGSQTTPVYTSAASLPPKSTS